MTDATRVETPVTKMVKLYKMDASPPARAAMIACELFNVPAKMIDINLQDGDQLKPDYLKKNPLHTVPVLEDGDLIIHDSHAILMYLADVYGKDDSFYPKEPKQRAEVNQKLFYDASVLYPRLRNVVLRVFAEDCKEIPQKELNAVEEAYGFTEEFLSRTKYLAGDNITIADIATYVMTTGSILYLDLNEQKYPKTHAWLKDLEKLPYVQKQNAKGAELYKQMVQSKLG